MFKKIFLSLLFYSICYSAEWSAPITLSDNSNYALGAQITQTENGKAIAIWQWTDDSTLMDVIQTSTSPDFGITWSTPVTISDISMDTVSPQITQTEDGKAIAIWQWLDTGTAMSVIQTSTSADFGTTWSTPVTLSDNLNNAITPQITQTEDGKAIAIWQWADAIAVKNVIQISTSPDFGITWSTPVTISDILNNASTPQITQTENGKAIAIWQWLDTGTGKNVIQTSTSPDFGASWSTPVTLSSNLNNASIPQITQTENGKAIAIWRWLNTGTGKYVIQTSISADFGASWSTPVTLSDNSQDANYPQITQTENGKAIAIWQWFNTGTGKYVIQTSISADFGASWSTPVTISNNLDAAYSPQITQTEDGKAIAIWQWNDVSSSLYIIQTSASADFGASWSTPVTLSDISDSASSPQITQTEDGKAIAIWDWNDPSTNMTVVQVANFIMLNPVKVQYNTSSTNLLLQKDNVNQLFWNSIIDAEKYRVYFNSLSNLIWEGSALYYFQHGVDSTKENTYYISWIDLTTHKESDPAVVTIP